MNKSLVKKYIEKIEKKDIIEYASKENVSITENELNLILEMIRNDSDIILSNQFPEYIQQHKNYFSEQLYNTIIEKYSKYKGFIGL